MIYSIEQVATEDIIRHGVLLLQMILVLMSPVLLGINVITAELSQNHWTSAGTVSVAAHP